MNNISKREVDEAIEAGERVLDSLYEALKYLKKAGNWGLVDIFGGNFLSGLFKHTNMSNAQSCLDQVKYELQNFEGELRDVSEYYNLNVSVGTFITFADFFWDGLLADFFVQSKISQTRRNVEQAINKVEDMLMTLRGLR